MRASLIGIVLALWAEPSLGQPDPSRSSVPDKIFLVGTHQGVPDPLGAFTVNVRNHANAPLAFSPVMVDFSSCPDLFPSSSQPYPGLSMNCAVKLVTGYTDANGNVTFDIVGSVLHRSPAATSPCAAVRAAGGVLLKTVKVAAVDQDAVDGVGPNDYALFRCDFGCFPFCPPNVPTRSDYSPSDGYTIEDLSTAFALQTSEASSETGPRCDGLPTKKPIVLGEDGGLNVAWDECVSGGGSNVATSLCLANTGSRSLVFSIVGPTGATGIYGFVAQVLVIARNAAAPLPDWWRFDACRSGSLTSPQYIGGNCYDGPTSVGSRMDYPYYEPFAARIRVVGFLDTDLVPGAENPLFKLSVDNAKTFGTGACAGCSESVAIVFESVRLVRAGACNDPAMTKPVFTAGLPDIEVDQAATFDRAYWQSAFTGVEPGLAATSLMLARDGANPSSGEPGVLFSLGPRGSASLELFQVDGRRVESHDVSGLGPGMHRFTLGAGQDLAPGLYLVRIRQGAESRFIKVSIVR